MASQKNNYNSNLTNVSTVSFALAPGRYLAAEFVFFFVALTASNRENPCRFINDFQKASFLVKSVTLSVMTHFPSSI